MACTMKRLLGDSGVERKTAHRLLVAATLLLVQAAWIRASENFSFAAEALSPHAALDRSGEIATSEGLTLHLNTDLGSVTIQTLPDNAPPVVRYSVHIETDAHQPLAQSLLEKYNLAGRATSTGVTLVGALPAPNSAAVRDSQFWVQYSITIPANYNVDVNTGAGDIETTELHGHVMLHTEGGNIKTGKLTPLSLANAGAVEHPLAKINTEGGHITVGDVLGDFDAFTGGGHIRVGNIDGSAKLRTGGGHIRAGNIRGAAQVETDGGNITVGEAATLSVRTGGGQIDLGEVHGSIRAQTAGGGVRAMYIAGPMEMETNGGSICLTRVANTVRAETGSGTITAWITPDMRDPSKIAKLPGPSQLGSSTGDIVVFLPRNIAANIDATVENGGPGRIEADPSLPLVVQAQGDGPVHALGVLNGGGALLRLRTKGGRIRLQYVDSEAGLRQSLQDEQKSRIARKLNDAELEQVNLRSVAPIFVAPPSSSSVEDKRDWLDSWIDRLEVFTTGSIHEDADEFKKRIVSWKTPEYPLLAKRAGLQGIVRLQIRVKTDGTVTVDKVLEGQATLVDAAETAVKQWRATPEEISGKKVDVISTVTFNFQLH